MWVSGWLTLEAVERGPLDERLDAAQLTCGLRIKVSLSSNEVAVNEPEFVPSVAHRSGVLADQTSTYPTLA